jgi:hypothetical protein
MHHWHIEIVPKQLIRDLLFKNVDNVKQINIKGLDSDRVNEFRVSFSKAKPIAQVTKKSD